MRLSLMDPAFPDLVAQHTPQAERVADSFLDRLGGNPSIDEIVDALITATAEQEIAESRIW
jgi:hypothetical protein